MRTLAQKKLDNQMVKRENQFKKLIKDLTERQYNVYVNKGVISSIKIIKDGKSCSVSMNLVEGKFFIQHGMHNPSTRRVIVQETYHAPTVTDILVNLTREALDYDFINKMFIKYV